MYTSELVQLVNFLEARPELSDLALYLGTNACLSGELSKVYIGMVLTAIYFYIKNFIFGKIKYKLHHRSTINNYSTAMHIRRGV